MWLNLIFFFAIRFCKSVDEFPALLDKPDYCRYLILFFNKMIFSVDNEGMAFLPLLLQIHS